MKKIKTIKAIDPKTKAIYTWSYVIPHDLLDWIEQEGLQLVDEAYTLEEEKQNKDKHSKKKAMDGVCSVYKRKR